MAKDKERTLNPAQQQRKLEKARQLKKSRAELQARRNEKMARRNPDRIQRQIADLKALEASGDIKPREKAILEELERDLRAVLKAREALGDKAPKFSSGSSGPQQRRQRDGSDNNVLGKRRYDGERKRPESSSGSDTDESVRRIPMPEDTPPPIPREFRRDLRARHADQQETSTPATAKQEGGQDTNTRKVAAAPVVKTTYESAPQIRDLRKEAVGRFVPSVVRKKLEAAKGGGLGRLVEPEEMDRLEAEGYAHAQARTGRNAQTDPGPGPSAGPATGIDDARLAEEEERFLCELGMQDGNEETANEDDGPKGVVAGPSGPEPQIPSRHVEIEEVEDEEA
ncbi:hypothetical protein ABEF92_000990 [Exophiala dermatitidis]|uniref:Wbp11/ELF5/Saf1 N-terminal domain-containing protein n=1 Tax=Exophiala dermatitidis (strain ATCC 34100 / CBS 525.76 / NIH/UT8656) TaxID=858893 RepID=H6BYV4_EXODN|nr:uncharacterized protein HMPREF1120_04882 [Exophiala dermatitidis NIH/UT8656]EHY56817.1 hypothetical protein HMPREF1120_04882 [Exophiala dermatitidis NIH/UT8656]